MTNNVGSNKKNVYIDALIGKNNTDYGRILPMGDIINGMTDWVRVLDLEGNVMFMNNAMKQSAGAKYLGRKCYSIFAEPSLVKSVYQKRHSMTDLSTRRGGAKREVFIHKELSYSRKRW